MIPSLPLQIPHTNLLFFHRFYFLCWGMRSVAKDKKEIQYFASKQEVVPSGALAGYFICLFSYINETH